jgi:hypothetical protein
MSPVPPGDILRINPSRFDWSQFDPPTFERGGRLRSIPKVRKRHAFSSGSAVRINQPCLGISKIIIILTSPRNFLARS